MSKALMTIPETLESYWVKAYAHGPAAYSNKDILYDSLACIYLSSKTWNNLLITGRMAKVHSGLDVWSFDVSTQPELKISQKLSKLPDAMLYNESIVWVLYRSVPAGQERQLYRYDPSVMFPLFKDDSLDNGQVRFEIREFK